MRERTRTSRPRERRPAVHSSCCSARTAPTRRIRESRPGKIPTTSVRRRALGPGEAGPDGAAGRGRDAERADRPDGRVSRPTAIGWRDRYVQGGIAALEDEPRSGRPAVIDEIDVVVATLANEGRPPQRLGISHWSASQPSPRPGAGEGTDQPGNRLFERQRHRLGGIAPLFRSPAMNASTPTLFVRVTRAMGRLFGMPGPAARTVPTQHV
jgi:hypothetical protein